MSSRHPNFGVHIGSSRTRGRLTASELQTFQQDITLGNTAAGATIPVLYGPCPVNGDTIAEGYLGSPQELVVAVAWGFGEIHQVKKSFINGVDVSTLTGVKVHHYRGTTYQAADEWLASAVAAYTDTLVMTKPAGNVGIAYSVFRIPAGVVGSSPRFQAIVEGGLVYDPRSSSTGDPFYSNVGFSVDFSGTTDASTYAHTVSLYGDAYSGGDYLVLDGSGDYAAIPDHGSTEFSSGAWTLEITPTVSSVSGTDYLVTKSSGSSPDLGFELFRVDSDLHLNLSSAGTSNDIQSGVIDSGTFAATSPETDYVIVVEFTGYSYVVWVNGSKVWETYTSDTVHDNSQAWQIGARAGASTWTGRIRSTRFTQGNFRYGGNHSTTNRPFIDSGTYTAGFVYSDNPALCFGDLATNAFYGLNTTVSGLSDAADWCDEALRSAVARAKLSLAIYEPRKSEKWLDYIATSADCLWFHEGTGVKIIADKPVGESNPSGKNHVADPDFDTDSWTTTGGWAYGLSYLQTEGGDRIITESGDYIITEDSELGTYFHAASSPQAEGSLSKVATDLDAGSEHVITLVATSCSTGTFDIKFDGAVVKSGLNAAGTHTVTVTPSASSPEPLVECVTTDSDVRVTSLSIKRKYWLEETWVKNSLSTHGLSTNDTPTKVSVRYKEKSDTEINWQEKITSFELPDVTAGDIPLIETTLSLDSVYREEEASNKAETRLLRMQNRVRVSWVSTDIGLAYQRGTVVQLRSTLRGIDMLVLVESVVMQSPGRYKVSGLRYDDDQYPSEVALGAGTIPIGAITLNDSTTIPSGWSVWSSANGKFIKAWNDAVSPQTLPGHTGGSATYAGFSGNTATGGAHDADDHAQFKIYDTVSGSDIGSYDKVSGDLGGHVHTYSTGTIDPEIYARETVFIKKTGTTSSTFPQSAMVFGLPTVSIPNLFRTVAYQNRLLKAASAPANSGVLSKTVAITTGSTDDTHTHRTLTPSDSRAYSGGPNQAQYPPEEGGGPHTHTASIAVARNIKRYRLALFSGTGSFTVKPGVIIAWEGAITGSPEPFPGWVLCDGNNGAPDLRDHFIEIAATGSEGTSAGDNTLSISATTSTVYHEHRGSQSFSTNVSRDGGHSNNLGHNHGISASAAYEPECYVLYFLMYVGA